LGEIVIEFFPNDAPKHVSNFITLANQEFYNETLFHRIIPGFMIQGGDPNTINGNENSWGTGGPDERINAEFNSIKHNRGIVSMARSADPNSAGSQFFIVHKDSNFLDGEYTVFGRIATQESFETLDKIAAVETRGDKPINPEELRIIKTSILNKIDVTEIIPYVEPERIESEIFSTPEFTTFESKELDVKFTAPVGWLLQQPPKSTVDAPDVVAVGPKIDGVNPYISLTIKDAKGKTLNELIIEKNQILDQAVYLNKLEIINQEKLRTNVFQTEAIGSFISNDVELKIKFLETLILSNEKSYTFAYSNLVDNFDDEISKYNETLNSFEILSASSSESKSLEEQTTQQSEEGGGCLIATATYGSEMSQQVQQLRELRDNQLLQTESGKQFMGTFNDIYYSFSPVIADYERENPLFKEAVKLAITPMISSLSLMENAESESEVLGLGLSVITLNIGMYLGIPAIIIFGIKKRN
jgi:peptidyl-prolyl cis-trans isomerase B (cyclophilin B)